MSNLYDLLGVAKGASDGEIKKAYHKMAKTLHPDVNPDAKAQEKFKAVSKAYEILSDKSKRARYDAGEIDDNGNPTPFGAGAYDGAHGGFGGFGGGRTYRQGNTTYTNINPEDLASMFGGMGGMGSQGFDFADLFGMGSRRTRTRAYPQSQDVQYDLTIPFNLIATGGETTVSLGSKRLKIKVPAGIEEGGTLRLRGQGQNGGDALIKVHIQPSSLFTREGNNLIVKVPITLKEAILGTTITLPLPSGTVAIKVPPYTDADKTLRLRGKGIGSKGDCLVHFNIVLPPKNNKDLTNFAQSWLDPTGNPRKF